MKKIISIILSILLIISIVACGNKNVSIFARNSLPLFTAAIAGLIMN